MKVVATVVGTTHRDVDVTWPEGWPIPAVGDEVEIPGITDIHCVVRTVIWYPHGDSWDRSADPFVYLVLGPRRPS